MNPQLLRGAEPVLVRRPSGTAPSFPKPVSENCDFIVRKTNRAVALHAIAMCLTCEVVGLLRVLKRLPGALMSTLVILLFVSLGGNAVGVRGSIVQFSGSLMIFVM
jgi:hypothetical protein